MYQRLTSVAVTPFSFNEPENYLKSDIVVAEPNSTETATGIHNGCLGKDYS